MIRDFVIRYGEKEFYYGKNVLASCMLGIRLSIPNILMQLFRKSSKQHIAPWYSLAMNILLHFAYGNLLAKPFHIGGNNSLKIGYVFLALYIVILLFFLYATYGERENYKYIFNQLYHSSKDFEELSILDDLINNNRKLPPKVLIKATAQHEESREVLKELQSYQNAVYATDYHIWNDGTVKISGIMIILKISIRMSKIIIQNGKELMKEEVKLKINKENKVIHLINLLQL